MDDKEKRDLVLALMGNSKLDPFSNMTVPEVAKDLRMGENKANEVLSNIKKNGTSIDEVNDLDLKDLLKKMLNQKKEERIDWNDYFSHKFVSSEKWQ